MNRPRSYSLNERERAWLLPLVIGILRAHRGQHQAITGLAIARQLGFKDDRRIRVAIRELTDAGNLIASTQGKNAKNGEDAIPPGYFLVSTREEAEEYLRTLSGRALSILARRKSVAQAIEREFGIAFQPLLFEESAPHVSPPSPPTPTRLTPVQKQILELSARGLDRDEIAATVRKSRQFVVYQLKFLKSQSPP